MKWKLLLVTILAVLAAAITLTNYHNAPHLSWSQCVAQADPALQPGDPFEYQPNCDGFSRAGALMVGLLPLAGLVLYGIVRYGGWVLGKIPIQAWRFDPLHYKTAKDCGVCRHVPVRIALFTLAFLGVAVGLFSVTPGNHVAALGGTVPTLDCSADINNAFTISPTTIATRAAGVDAGGALYLQTLSTNATYSHDVIKRIGRDCNTVWSLEPCSTSCRVLTAVTTPDVHGDVSGHYVTTWLQNPSGPNYNVTIISLYAGNGTTDTARSGASAPWTTEVVGTPLSNTSAADIIPVRVNATSMDYILSGPFSGTSHMDRWNNTFASRSFTVASGNEFFAQSNQSWMADLNQFATFTQSGGSVTYVLRNLTTGAVERTSGGITQCYAGEQMPWRSQTNTSRVYVMNSNGVCSEARYIVLNATTLASVTASTAFSPSQIDDGGLRSTIVNGAQLDGDGTRFLACGQYSNGAENRGFVASFLTANNTMDWNLTVDLGLSTKFFNCRFDYAAGFYVWGDYTDASGVQHTTVRHYSGGGFVQPAPDPSVVNLPVSSATPNPGTIDAGAAFVTLASGTGFGSASGKFLFGFFLMIVFMAIGAALLKNIGSAQIGMGGVVIIGLGEGFFNVLIGLWDAVYIVLLIIVGAAIVTIFVRKQFGGSGGGNVD